MKKSPLTADKKAEAARRMTFLLFLASLAVLQRVVSRAEKTRLPGGSPPDAAAQRDAPLSIVPDTAGLAALSRSLDMYGRGNVPSPAPAAPSLPAPWPGCPIANAKAALGLAARHWAETEDGAFFLCYAVRVSSV